MTLYVTNLPARISEQQLIELFDRFGNVREIELPKDQFSGLAKGFAFVHMNSEEGVYDAINALNHYVVEGSAIFVQRASNKVNHSPQN